MAGRPNIVLTGFMATGKSTVGRRLAERTGRTFVDTDEVIVARHGPIPEIFATLGEAAFRRFEHEVSEELAARSDLVVSTGGRLMLDPGNATVLGHDALVVCLTASAEEILRRVAADGATRPLLAGSDEDARVRELLAERAEGYGAFTQIGTEGRSVDEIVDEILTHAP